MVAYRDFARDGVARVSQAARFGPQSVRSMGLVSAGRKGDMTVRTIGAAGTKARATVGVTLIVVGVIPQNSSWWDVAAAVFVLPVIAVSLGVLDDVSIG